MIRLALRNLARNRWRSGLTVGGVAVAVAALAWTQGLIEAIVRTQPSQWLWIHRRWPGPRDAIKKTMNGAARA